MHNDGLELITTGAPVKRFLVHLYLLINRFRPLPHHVNWLIRNVLSILVIYNLLVGVLHILARLDSSPLRNMHLGRVMRNLFYHPDHSFLRVVSLKNYILFLSVIHRLGVVPTRRVFHTLCFLVVSVVRFLVVSSVEGFKPTNWQFLFWGLWNLPFLPFCSVDPCHFSQLSDFRVNVLLTHNRNILLTPKVISMLSVGLDVTPCQLIATHTTVSTTSVLVLSSGNSPLQKFIWLAFLLLFFVVELDIVLRHGFVLSASFY